MNLLDQDRPWKYTMIDLFAGAGGLSQGLKRAGFKSLYANEVVPAYARTFALNHPGTFVESEDVRGVDAREVRARLGVRRGELDLIAGGPPCQGFSINAPVRRADDHRNHLFRDYLRFVEEFQPRAVLIENVPGLVSFGNGTTLQSILTALSLLGYAVDVRILYAPLYGVPQTRWRTVVLGMRDFDDASAAFPLPSVNSPARVNFTSNFAGRSLISVPENSFLPGHTTVRDAIDDLPILGNGEDGLGVGEYKSIPNSEYQRALRIGSTGVRNHEAARLGAINLARLRHIPPGGNWTDIPEDLLPAGMRRARRTDHTKRYGRVDPDGLASTILTKCDPHWGAYFHYDQDRTFTVREAARLQSFPDSYVFTGSRVEQYEQVGNAVPPMLATAVGNAIAVLLEPVSGTIATGSGSPTWDGARSITGSSELRV
ncbi:DNA (cytosine-5)-methyltransferase 1 [Arthrobacter sp. CAN_A212]|uniref:DNA cytosine methyltransferase n=1 Tax=Arthrobacter sp. CAN_A212 TaxID=2787719 RepID=UPI0018CBB598